MTEGLVFSVRTGYPVNKYFFNWLQKTCVCDKTSMSRYKKVELPIIIHQSMLYELLSNLIGSLLLYYNFILH